MQVKTQSCVVAGKKTVAITDQNIEWNNKGTLVQITRGGICGSDLHYYQEGKVGNFTVKAPMILGHEVIGKVDIIENGVFDSFVFTTDGIPFKEAMKLRTTLIKQKGSFVTPPSLNPNPDFTQKEF